MAASRPAKPSKLNFKLELSCSCTPPICSHSGAGIAKLLEAAYAKVRSDGMQDAVQGIAKAAAKIGVKVEVQRTPAGVRQAGSKRTQ